jgi:GNAT superfamily N-acetyltransferase
MGHAYLSDRLDHIHALLGLNAYQRCAGEIYLEWPDFTPTEPPPCALPVEFTLDWRPGQGALPGLVILAHHAGAEIGECVNVSCGEYSRAAPAQEAFLTKWLGVKEDCQGQGLGRHLLQRAQWEMRRAGYRHAVISTSWTNHRACLFYGNCGYRARDWTYALSRKLG